jgi:hypothetical protein
MIKKIMFMFVLAVSSLAQVCAVPRFAKKAVDAVGWSIKKVDDLQFWIFNTKTSISTARLVLLAALSLHCSGEVGKPVLDSIATNPLGFLGKVLVGPSGVKRVVSVVESSSGWAGDGGPEFQYYKKLSVAAWAVILLTAWNNDRAEHETKKPAVETKKPSLAEKSSLQAQVSATA